MVRRHLVMQSWTATLMALFSLCVVARAHAQPPPDDPSDGKPPQMCGTVLPATPNGETFTVSLPARNGPNAPTNVGPTPNDIDDKWGLGWAIEVEDVVPDDTITLPKGCRIYAFLISGWNDNAHYDHIVFYQVAQWVAMNNGYVHVGWWNNLTAPYMERPLHDQRLTVIPQLFGIPTGNPSFNYFSTPGITDFSAFDLRAFVQTDLDLPKANPDEDFQFVADFAKTLKEVRDNNPDAFILVAGHSMGADAIAHTLARLSQSTTIDLVALIDPVGNRDRPFKPYGSTKYQWTRWRSTHNFRGWKVRDCERMVEPSGVGPCRPVGFLGLQVNCKPRGDWLLSPPGIFAGSVRCPGFYEDDGPLVNIGDNVRHLYHRWQTEAEPPTDYDETRTFNRAGFPSRTAELDNTNSQARMTTASPANGNCGPEGYDPLDDRYQCFDGEGHGELIGVRVKSDRNHEAFEGPDQFDRVHPGLKLIPWTNVSEHERRNRLIDLARDGPDWPYKPRKPELCLVCQDIIDIAADYLEAAGSGADTTPPTSGATTSPDANAQGWFNEDVVVSVSATDAGSGVGSIELMWSGASTGTTTTPGSSAETTLTAEGLTTVSHFARDVNGNIEAAHTLDIRIDKTFPEVNGVTDVLPNAYGWFGSPVVVTFSASDEAGGSGLATSSTTAVSVNTEGTAQEIVGLAEDFAGNITSALVTLNIDLTPPELVAIADIPPNGNGWNNADVRVSFEASDAPSGIASGIASSTPETVVSTEGANQQIVGTATDRAGHTASASVVVSIDKTAPQITATPDIAPNSHGWNSSDVVVSFAASDALSELASSSPAAVTVTVSSEGEAQTIARTVEDRAGNTASASLVVNIDKIAPTIALFRRTPANDAGWNNTDVNLIWDCSDALSRPVADQVSQSLTAEGAGQNAVGTCADRAGHTASDAQSGINIDKTSPANQIATPAQGAAYVLNATVMSAYRCDDTLSGVSTCAGPVANDAAIDTATVGAKTFTVSSTDAAGNPGVASHTYYVQYTFSGFSNPIAALPAVNKATAGRTVPVKYSLRDANGAVITDLTSFASLVSAPAACDTNVPTADAEETDAAGSTTIHFDAGQFIYNWQTQSAWAGTCRALQLTLTDGTQHTVAFQFR